MKVNEFLFWFEIDKLFLFFNEKQVCFSDYFCAGFSLFMLNHANNMYEY